jgi:hypothetical protein
MEQTIKLIRPKSKTQGLEWLLLSFAAFNGSGYGDMSTPENFVLSYIAYNTWKNRQEAVRLATEYVEELYKLADHLIETSNGASHKPNEKQWNKFIKFKQTYKEPVNLFW